MKIIQIILVFMFCSYQLFAAIEDDLKLFNQANTAYDNADYKTAISNYQNLINQHPKSGELYYNLANSYYKNNELGKAIFHYIKALEILPRHGDIRFNLDYARNQTVDKQERTKGFVDLINFPFNKDELIILTTLTCLFFWLMMIISLYKRNFIIISFRSLCFIATVFWVILIIITQLDQKKIGIITAEETSIFSSTGANATKLFTLHEGSEVTVLDTRDNWVLVTLGENKKGWLPSDNLIFSP